MSDSFSMDRGRGKRSVVPFFVLLLILAALGAGVYLFLTRGKTIVSPIPKESAITVIYYTPTPAEMTPTSTPSATPKVKPTVQPTKKPTGAVTPSTVVTLVSVTKTPSATPKVTATLTPKP